MSITVAEYRKICRKPRKYRNKPTAIDGHKFDSRKEAKRYSELKLMKLAGDIWDLQVHPRFKLEVNGVWVGQYTADFAYRERQQFKQVVEDCKSDVTKRIRDWPIRKRLMLAIHGIEVREL